MDIDHGLLRKVLSPEMEALIQKLETEVRRKRCQECKQWEPDGCLVTEWEAVLRGERPMARTTA